MDKEWAQEVAKDAAEKMGKEKNEAEQRTGPEITATPDPDKSVVQDIASRASEAGRQAAGQAREFMEGVAPQAKQAAGDLYDQGIRSGEQIRQYVVQQPLTALLVAGAIGYILAYMVHRS